MGNSDDVADLALMRADHAEVQREISFLESQLGRLRVRRRALVWGISALSGQDATVTPDRLPVDRRDSSHGIGPLPSPVGVPDVAGRDLARRLPGSGEMACLATRGLSWVCDLVAGHRGEHFDTTLNQRWQDSPALAAEGG